jgi:hypothetical protein
VPRAFVARRAAHRRSLHGCHRRSAPASARVLGPQACR